MISFLCLAFFAGIGNGIPWMCLSEIFPFKYDVFEYFSFYYVLMFFLTEFEGQLPESQLHAVICLCLPQLKRTYRWSTLFLCLVHLFFMAFLVQLGELHSNSVCFVSSCYTLFKFLDLHCIISSFQRLKDVLWKRSKRIFQIQKDR